MQQPALIIMVKNPIAGKTKTRLAQDVGHAMALEMYGILCRHTRDQVLALEGVTRYLHYSEYVEVNDDWPNRDFIKLVQVGTGLGERMTTAFDRAFARGHGRVVIIGTDCPGLAPNILQQALTELERSDLVVGPANDGGYYLLGMRHPHPELFADMEWSTSEVLEQTLARARVRGLSVATLPALSDVDHLEDWVGFGWPMPRGQEEE